MKPDKRKIGVMKDWGQTLIIIIKIDKSKQAL